VTIPLTPTRVTPPIVKATPPVEGQEETKAGMAWWVIPLILLGLLLCLLLLCCLLCGARNRQEQKPRPVDKPKP